MNKLTATGIAIACAVALVACGSNEPESTPEAKAADLPTSISDADSEQFREFALAVGQVELAGMQATAGEDQSTGADELVAAAHTVDDDAEWFADVVRERPCAEVEQVGTMRYVQDVAEDVAVMLESESIAGFDGMDALDFKVSGALSPIKKALAETPSCWSDA